MENQWEVCKKGLGKSRGRGEKDHRNPGGGLIRDQNPGHGLQLKPFFRGICIDILYTLDSISLLVKLKPGIFQRLPPFE